MFESEAPTAAILVIGNEILTGRTQDANLNALAKKLFSVGVRLLEARVVPDVESSIVTAVSELRKTYTYLFTTGGIGPTHDDITADAVAKAFGVAIGEHPDARKRLEAHYKTTQINEARLRMARMPKGAVLIDNPVSAAPGFRVENVYVLAGVPEIAAAMMDSVLAGLKHGPAIHTVTISGYVAESLIADALRVVAEQYPQLDIGSYPWMRLGRFGTALVVRGTDKKAVEAAADAIVALVKGHDPEFQVQR